ncbi:GIY-YIG nuclease family protein [Neoaquamicrobium sediminum]|uniref:GIY-YIG nuclease family protein n=1 Tax=Neoaquamicrobium sediminum TaxID=1849104 RepID=UPI0015675727|nr:GIY-YIG nuclease family protein [Mesorhizobium sediminum]NRC53236.1 GIY-YIG nuclease family protein [Mesorhizobium sediminum]
MVPSQDGGYVYILASRKHGTLYIGVTADLERRIWEHREGLMQGFIRKYSVDRLVWYRDYDDIRDAIDDEKRIKKWRRKWKLDLVEAMNPEWNDLYETLNG